MSASPTTGLTYDDLQRFPDDGLRRELIGGELHVTPSPNTRHQSVVLELGAALLAHGKSHGGRAFVAPLDVYFSHSDVVEPDVLFVAEQHRGRIEERMVRSAPDLVVEVSSPSTRRTDLIRKRALYERFGVPEYWFVDLDADRVEAYRLTDGRYPAPVLFARGELLPSAVLPGFAIGVDELLDA